MRAVEHGDLGLLQLLRILKYGSMVEIRQTVENLAPPHLVFLLLVAVFVAESPAVPEAGGEVVFVVAAASLVFRVDDGVVAGGTPPPVGVRPDNIGTYIDIDIECIIFILTLSCCGRHYRV